ncbi:helix-turn-helix domain-containing protein [Bacillus sp. Bva_UNVM-123]|uniref:CdaR family transcriptional regulator n=1 Tax=Bacillus sp. Bva_UNVM-123 TaxID=2829798 RepID=UPI00391F262C
MLTKKVAKEIVEQTMNRLNRNINIMDENGTIIASGDLQRVNKAHYGAIEVLRSGMPLIIRENEQKHWEGARPGINLPIQFQNDMIGVMGITGNSDEIMEFGELVKMITEMIIQQSFLMKQLEWKQHMKELIFEEVISFPLNMDSIMNRLQLIEVQLCPPYQVAMINLELFHVKKSELFQLLEHFFNPKHTLIGFLNANLLFIVNSKMKEADFIAKLCKSLKIINAKGIEAKIGMGLQVMELAHIKHYEEALSSLKASTLEMPIIAYADIEIQALLEQINKRSRQQFSTRILNNLSEKLIQTVEQFIAHNLNISDCAKSMFIHRNSLIYRIKQIKEKTGYDPQHFQDALTLQLAIWIWKMKEKK